MVQIKRADSLYRENIEFICDNCKKVEQYDSVTIDEQKAIFIKLGWLSAMYIESKIQTMKIFCCEKCKKEWEKKNEKSN